jgi:ABC-type transport system involved in multi-copper enzyme maturation permease subunit
MVLEQAIPPFLDWLRAGWRPFLGALLAAAALALFVGFLASALRHGPINALRITFGTALTGMRELSRISPRRVLAMARLAFQESLRRRVLVVFGVFVIALLFGGWFLDRHSNHPARLYLSFVLTATNYLVLMLAIFLSAFSLPNDVKNRTIYTIVTKPVVAWEIVIGRLIGFCAVGTLMLALMCLFSYFFVQRGLRHTHDVDPQQLVARTYTDDGVTRREQRGVTSLSGHHRHEFTVRDDGRGVVKPERDHTHDVEIVNTGEEQRQYELGSARGLLLARVPVRGKLRFLDRTGRPGEGTNVGYEWKYRKYIEGGTLAAAIWRFEGLQAKDFPDGLPLEMTIRVFRSYKGEIEEGITGIIELVKPAPLGPDGMPTAPDGGLRSIEWSFTAQDFSVMQQRIPREIVARDGSGNERTVDIFRDLVDPRTGELEVWIRCLDREQYLGMAPADLYLRAANRPFWMNFVKGYVSIWFQMVVVTGFGVAFSTFLSGPVAMVATLAAMVMGFFKGFAFDVASGEMPGGGPLESFVRLVRQWNQLTELEESVGTWIVQRIDGVLMLIVQAISYAMPNCGMFNTSRFVAYGFDIPADLMAQHLTVTLAYAAVVSVAGYFFFKTREIAA